MGARVATPSRPLFFVGLSGNKTQGCVVAGGGVVQDVPNKSLAEVAIFHDLAPVDRQPIERQCRWRQYATGETIIERGMDSRDVLFIVKGAVHVVNYSHSGREISYATLRSGECVGELSAIDGQPRSASVVAAEPTLVAVLSAEAFLRILQEQAAVSFRVLKQLTTMVRTGDARIMELSTIAATQRVYSELLRMARPDAAVPHLWVIHPLPPLREIASRVSTTRETVARALSQIAPTGLVRRKGRSLYIMDRAGLEQHLAEMQHETGA